MLKIRTWLSLVCLLFCLIVLTAMLILHAWPLWTGQVIILRTQPVDPRDLFRGDYVIVSYAINSLRVPNPTAPSSLQTDTQPTWMAPSLPIKSLGKFAARTNENLPNDSLAYVQLESRPVTDDPTVKEEYIAVSICDQPIDGKINLQGRIRQIYSYGGGYLLTMHYGIDAFFVQEGHGRQIEQALRASNNRVFAEIAVASSGKARLKNLIINGKPILPP